MGSKIVNGTDVADNPSTVAASSDGTVWITTMGAGQATTPLAWGNPTSIYGGHYASGYGQIGALGQIMQGNDLPALPDMAGYNQGYMGNITMRGTTAYLQFYVNSDAYWNNQTPADLPAKGNPMTISIPTVATPQGTPYNNPGYGNKYTHDLLSSNSADPVSGIKGGYGGTGDSVVLSDGSMVFCGWVQPPPAGGSSDKFTLGDFSGTVGYNNWVGKVAADGVTLSGPANQPSGDATRDYFADVAVNEANGHVFVTGYSYQGTPTNWDPDGSGPLAPYAYTNTAGIGTGVLYDGSWNIVKSVVWDTNQSGEAIYDVVSTPDGGWVAVGQTTGDLKAGATNPTPGTRDMYVAKYDSTGALVWDYQSQTAYYDYAGDVTVDPDGNIYVSGSQQVNTDNDPTLTKFTSAGTLVWTSVIDNSGSQDAVVDHGNVDKYKVYVLSANNPTIGGVWTSTTGYVPQGNNENLLQKLIPGDFNSDGFVDFANDVQTAGAATQPGPLAGDDTYDFDGDGNSTLADTYYMITNIMDRIKGDIEHGGAASDVDNADIGRAIGSHNGAAGTGKVYLDGDIDFDGDVDDDDVAFVAGAYTGATTPSAPQATLGTGTTLTYIADQGTVWLSADGAAGGVITSFQLENNQGTFVPSSYTGPVAGSFGGALEDVTTNVIADTDLTLAGVSGDLSLGAIFPLGMDQAGLEAYLTTAVYTGAQGTGQMDFDLVWLETLPTAYEAWAGGFAGLTDIDAGLDFDGGGLATGIEYVVGGDPTVGGDDATLAPTGASDGSGGLIFTFRRTALANDDPDTTIVAEYSVNLTSWTTAEDAVDGVSIVENTDFYGAGIDQVVVSLPAGLAAGGELYARLNVGGLPITLLNEDFEGVTGPAEPTGWSRSDNGASTAWEVGAPSGAATGPAAAANGTQCAGTNIGADYTGSAEASLITMAFAVPASGATLHFSQYIDTEVSPSGDLGSIRLLNAGDDSVLAGGDVATGLEGITEAWTSESIALPAVANGLSVKLEFRFVSDADADVFAGFYIDDVKVTVP